MARRVSGIRPSLRMAGFADQPLAEDHRHRLPISRGEARRRLLAGGPGAAGLRPRGRSACNGRPLLREEGRPHASLGARASRVPSCQCRLALATPPRPNPDRALPPGAALRPRSSRFDPAGGPPGPEHRPWPPTPGRAGAAPSGRPGSARRRPAGGELPAA